MKKRRSDRPGGKVPGYPYPLPPAFSRAARTANWRHGATAKVVTPLEGRMSRLKKLHKDAPQIFADIVESLSGGDHGRADAMAASALVETEILRRSAVDQIRADGVAVREPIRTAEGVEIGSRLRANPLLESVRHMNEQLGVTADALQLTRKSRGEGARDTAVIAMLARDAMLRAYDKSLCPAPGPIIDVRTVAEKSDVRKNGS